ncbi:hypothetical protein Bca52824_001978 [Brassica carinata]|uniref:BRCT domain-containing protein n=1 Tax=Brassica carinata TaxID=52824 RepID=A0A8X7WH37_BRACI|nr:hypothetical protein Bca52824_001978 [Brassica carinata]
MVNHSDAEVYASDSKSPSASSDHRFEVDEIHDTEPIDDDDYDFSLHEIPFQNLYNDTELVVNEESLDLGLEEVVDDSEDDEGGGKGSVASSKPRCLLERNLKAADILLESDGSNDQECQTGQQESKCDNVTGFQGSSRITADDSHGQGLDYLDSQEPGDATQAEALGFVDQYIAWDEKKKLEEGKRKAKCCLSFSDLWINCKILKYANLLINYSWPIFLPRKEDPVKDDDPCEDRNVSTPPTRRYMQKDSAKHNKMDAQLQDKASKEHSEPEEDFVDVGINTQIAAEAMSALLFAPCTIEEASESEMRDQVSNLCGRDNDTIEDSAPNKKRNSKKKKNNRQVSNSNHKQESNRSTSFRTTHIKKRDKREPNISARRFSCNNDRGYLPAGCLSPRFVGSFARHDAIHLSILLFSMLKIANHNLNRDFLLSILDEFQYGLRRRRNLAHVRVLFSHNLDDETIKQQKKIMGRLGISPAASSAESTHFIAERFCRTRNMLEAIALGKPVVTPLWLESCGQTRCLLDEKNYILKDSKKEKEGFSMRTSLARAKQHPLLKGLKVCITPNVKPDRGMIAHLVKLTQGQVVEISEIIAAADREIPDDLLILSCEEDGDLCLPFIDQGAEIYTAELLLNGIVIQKLEYARHYLDQASWV